jgi:hypothetical protein
VSLSAQELDALKFQLGALLEVDEPRAILATLRRVAERKAQTVTRGKIGHEEAADWYAMAEALTEVENALARRARAEAPNSSDREEAINRLTRVAR